MVKEKKILTYFISWLIVGFIIIFMGVNNVFAEVINPTTGFKTQYGSFLSTNELKWSSTDFGSYNMPLSLQNSDNYAVQSFPGYIRLLTVTNVDPKYTYKLSYKMVLYALNTSNFNIKDIDKNYDLLLYDDNGIINESKCSINSSNTINGTNGTTIEKNITCTFTVLSSYTNLWFSSGYKCKDCSLNGVIDLGPATSDDYFYVLNPKLERFEDNSGVIIDQNQTIIDQNNQTNDKLDNLEQSIIDGNKETQDVIKDQFNTCHDSYNLINFRNFTGINSNTTIDFTNNGFIIINVSNGYGVQSNTLNLKPNTTYTISTNSSWEIDRPAQWGWRLYNVDDNTYSPVSYSDKLTFTTNDKTNYILYYYIGFPNNYNGRVILSNIMLNEGSTAKSYEPYGEEICTNKIDDTNDKLDDLNTSLNDSNSSGATNDASNFFSNFSTDTFGLTSIITAPLSLINNITSSSCSTLRLPLPYLDNEYLELPCMNSVYTRYFGSFFTIYQTITFGIVSYWVIVRIFNQVKDFKNPDHDEIEVLDL